jgi:hypothetical protein
MNLDENEIQSIKNKEYKSNKEEEILNKIDDNIKTKFFEDMINELCYVLFKH